MKAELHLTKLFCFVDIFSFPLPEISNDYCSDWKLTQNAEKTKTVIFNKTGATQINYGGELMETIKYFSYLGFTLDSNGNLHPAINELSKKLQKLQGDYITYLPLIMYPLKHY